MSGSLGAQMPFWHFDQDFLVFSDGSLGAGFELKGMDISSMSCDGINTINRGLGNLLASLPEGLSLQVFYQVMPDVGDLICRHKALSTSADRQGGQQRQASPAMQVKPATRQETLPKQGSPFWMQTTGGKLLRP